MEQVPLLKGGPRQVPGGDFTYFLTYIFKKHVIRMFHLHKSRTPVHEGLGDDKTRQPVEARLPLNI